jgi:hypothetical protein
MSSLTLPTYIKPLETFEALLDNNNVCLCLTSFSFFDHLYRSISLFCLFVSISVCMSFSCYIVLFNEYK